MRKGYKYITIDADQDFRDQVDSNIKEFEETMNYHAIAERVKNKEDFLEEFCSSPWVKEFHETLEKVLVKDRKTLGLGSGHGEHELLFYLKKYDITASDIVFDALEPAQDLFPGFPVLFMNILEPICDSEWEDLLITGLDSYFNDEQTEQIFRNCRKLLQRGNLDRDRRLIFTLRYNDNWVTTIIDTVILPMESLMKNFFFKITGKNKVSRKKHHGYRRSRKKIIKFAEKEGFEYKQVLYAGHGVECTRSSIFNRMPKFIDGMRALDKKLHMFNNITVFEFKLKGVR